MKLKLKLKAFAASLVLAAASGQAGATIQTGANGELFLTVVSSDNLVSFTKDLGITMDSFLSGFAGASVSLSTDAAWNQRSEEHTSELQSQSNLVCRLL